ncbi:hypothetical protein [Cellulophaga sp. BC115SP]|uniref:hypothetical protein n=1 Tax=Cellulophaga sp. BC115SP TaxID=2683263 RepID=UPI001413177D|nr:hypothetical protein [Cellulophaga sp. BC115SP]NBB29942.1 hypothetical protein [Cellulophaga sp. BC115SP]
MRVNEIKRDFRSLSMLLQQWSNVKNPSILGQMDVFDKKGVIGYNLEVSKPLIFQNIDLEPHSIPSGIEKIPNSDKDFSVQLCIKFSEKEMKINAVTDPIVDMGVSILIKGEYCLGSDLKETICSWHIDRHNGNQTGCFHPLYHLNFGGSNMTKLAINDNEYFGKLLLLPSPRIIHPPLDLILSCDFIIRNFYSTQTHSQITSQNTYKDLIKKAMDRYWKPYFYALSSKWDTSLTPTNLTFENATDINVNYK